MGAIPQIISVDILHYLQTKKGLSVNEIATALDSTPIFIKKVLKNKESLTSHHINAYLRKENKRFWEFALEAIPLDHLSEKARKRILLCKDLTNIIKKKKNRG
jgi:hypothetical protein